MKKHLQLKKLSIVLGVFTAFFFDNVSAAGVFPIATNTTNNMEQPPNSVAFDGTNYLVGFQIHLQPNTNSRVVAQLVSPTGTLIGSQINTGLNGDTPKAIGFDGTNYLMFWAYNGGSSNGQIFSQLISKSGSAIGSPFAVSQSTTVQELDAVAFGGTNYLVTWSDKRRPGEMGDRDIYARRVSRTGVPIGADFKISGLAGVESAVAFDGTNFLAVWRDDFNDNNIYGRLVNPSGGFVTSEFVIDGNSFNSDNPSAVIFDGINYVVAIHDVVGGRDTETWDLFGRFVTTAGAVLTNRFTISAAPGSQRFPKLAFDGVNYLITWLDGFNFTNVASSTVTCKARFFNTNGMPASSEFSPFTSQGNKSPLFAPVLFDGIKYFAVTGLAEILTNGTGAFAGITNGVIYGIFIPKVTTPPQLNTFPPLTNSQFKLQLSGTPGISYAIQTATNLLPTNTVWSGLVTNAVTNSVFTFDVVDTNATGNRRFYRAVKQ